MFEFVGNIVSGGWDAINNITTGVSNFGSNLFGGASGFFPTAQKKEPLSSSLMQPTIFSQNNFRVTSPDAPSLRETAAWAYDNWFDSPYENQFGIHETVPAVSGWFDPWKGAVDTVWNAATGAFSNINDQLPNLLMQKLGLVPKAQPQNSQGAVVYQVPGSQNTNPAPATYPAGWFEQMAGLFGLGYPAAGATPAVPISPPTVAQKAGISTGIIVLIGGAIVLVMLARKK